MIQVWGILGAVGTSTAYALLLAALRRADRSYPSTVPSDSTWWFGYARDLTNIAAAAGFTIVFASVGFPMPHAFLPALALTLALYGIDYACSRAWPRHRPIGWVTAAGTILGGLIVLWMDRAVGLLAALFRVLY